MAVIPRSIYREVEWHLHNVPRLIMEAVDEEPDRLPGGIVMVAGSKGRISDRTGDTALRRVEKAKKTAELEQWMACIEATRKHFDGRVEGDMAGRYYGMNKTVLAVADEMYVDKQTVNRYRDRYVAYLALLAACKGLIRMRK